MHSARVVPAAPRRDHAEHLAPFPPDIIWTWVATRQADHLVLPVQGRRSIFVAWPPGSYCELCSAIVSSGYAGPASGDRVHFPSATVHQVCEPCARRSLDLEPLELTGHRCVDACTDRLHLEVVGADELTSAGLALPGRPGSGRGIATPAGASRARSTAAGGSRARAASAGSENAADDRTDRDDSIPHAGASSGDASSTLDSLSARGWQIAEITALPRRCAHGTHRQVAVWIEPIRALPWPTERDDPWVW